MGSLDEKGLKDRYATRQRVDMTNGGFGYYDVRCLLNRLDDSCGHYLDMADGVRFCTLNYFFLYAGLFTMISC